MSRILLASAVNRRLNPALQARCLALMHRCVLKDPAHEFGIWIDYRTRAKGEGEDHAAHVCAVANRALEAVNLLDWDFVLWVDGDVVEYPGDICSRFLEVNPAGITAPLPLIEGSWRLYDTLGYVTEEGQHLVHDAPYWPEPPTERFVEMRSVGMCLLVPGWIFAKAGCPYLPGEAGWAAACRMARESGVRVGVDRSVTGWHADLPRFGHAWN